MSVTQDFWAKETELKIKCIKYNAIGTVHVMETCKRPEATLPQKTKHHTKFRDRPIVVFMLFQKLLFLCFTCSQKIHP